MRIGNQILYQIIWYRICRKTCISFIIIINNIIISKISFIWFILFIRLLIFTVSVSFIISVEYLCHITSYQVYHIVMFPYCFYLLLFCILLKWDIMMMERCTINYQRCQALLRTPTNFRARHHPHLIVICISINRSLSLCFRQ